MLSAMNKTSVTSIRTCPAHTRTYAQLH